MIPEKKELIKPKKKRCNFCRKKVGVVPFTCKCDPKALFCSLHRQPEAHNCKFDWKAEGAKLLEKKNPIVVVDKFGGNKI